MTDMQRLAGLFLQFKEQRNREKAKADNNEPPNVLDMFSRKNYSTLEKACIT